MAAILLCSGGCGVGTPSGTAPPPPSPSVPAQSPMSCVVRVITGMSQEQRVGQLFLLGLAGNRLGQEERDAIRAYHLGSVWFVDKSAAGVGVIRTVADAVQAQATASATADVRFYVAANQEGGQIQALSGPGFSRIPSAVAQGGLGTAELERAAGGWGHELREAGVNLDFAPVLDVVPPGTDARNQPIGFLQREYGHDPATAGSHGAAFLRGMRDAGVATTVKHFPGLGRVQGNTDFTAGVVDATTSPTDVFLQSFRQGIDAGAPFVMVALATYTRIDPNRMAVFSPAVMRDLLRDRMRFQGVVVSDDMGASAAVAGVPAASRAVDFVSAGGDMVVSKTVDAAVPMARAIVARASADAAFRARVDEAASRVLRAKQESGLLPC